LLIVGDDKQVSPTAGFIAEEKMLQLKHNFLRDQPLSELLCPVFPFMIWRTPRFQPSVFF